MKFLNYLRSPQFAIYAVAAWMVSFLVITGSQAHNNVSYLILILPTLVSLRFQEVQDFFRNRLGQLLFLVIATLILAAILGDGSPLQQAKFGAIVLLLYLAVARLPLLNEDTVYKAAWAFLGLITVYVLVNMVMQYAHGTWVPGMRLGDLNAKLENVIYVTNTMGGMLAVITLLGMRAKKYRAVIAAHVLVLLVALTILQTRSIIGVWALIMLLTYFNFYHQKSKRATFIIISIALAVVIAITLLLIYTPIGASLLQRNFYRPEIWHGYIAVTLRCGIWMGCGPEHAFQYISRDGNVMVHPHSVFVTQFYKAGLIGVIPLLALTILAITQGLRAGSWAGWYLAVGVLGLCFDGSSLVHSPSQRWLVFHLPLALLIAQQLRQTYADRTLKASA